MKEAARSENRIQDYGVIGDCRSTALVSRGGSIDWLCWPRFDSPSIFAAILDPDRGGYWSISPVHPFRVERNYVESTNILETHFVGNTGAASLRDLMPVASEVDKRNVLLPDHELIRDLVCTEGEIEIAVTFVPRHSYGLEGVALHDRGQLGISAHVGKGAYWLHGTRPLNLDKHGAYGKFTLRRGEAIQFDLTYSETAPCVLPALGGELSSRIERSIQWWKSWANRCSYDGPYRASVVRSALILKLLAYAPSGAIAAAPTTSLPEIVGGPLNWDYRYCWLRDASLTVRALLGLGYIEEAESFLFWMLYATRLTRPELRIMYNVFGKVASREREISFLRGYRNSRPVRVGNAARKQLQLDVYGELVDAAAQYVRSGGSFDRNTQQVLVDLGKYVADHWDEPDEGIWEPRTGQKNHTHSRLMCWTTLDRLLELHEKQKIAALPREQFVRERERIRDQIELRAWNPRIQSYTSILDGDDVDASLLRIPWYGMEKANSDRMRGTYRRVHQQLGAGNGLLYRYKRNPPEGAFGVCGFWGAEYLAIGGGAPQDAEGRFQQLLHYQNDLGLFAEEIDPTDGSALGNFPQAFTHIGLISTALSLKEHETGVPHPAEKRHQAISPTAKKRAKVVRA